MKTYSISVYVLLLALLGLNSKIIDSNNGLIEKNLNRNSAKEKSLAPKSILSDTWSGNGFHTYTHTLTLGSNRSCTWYVADVPNQITIKDSGGNIVYQQGWAGEADYYGPWGASIHIDATHPNTYYFNLSAGTYTVFVDTSTNTANGGLSDTWDIYY